jgi:hypothetical protein
MWLAPAPVHAQRSVAADADAAEHDAIRSERETSWALYGIGGTLLTGGGFATFGAVMPCVGRCEGSLAVLVIGGAAAGVGFVLFFVAVALGTDQHRRADVLRARGVTLAPGPGELGLGLIVPF